MTTAERVKAMTDSAMFERLAGYILRQKFPELSNMLIGGINERNETTKGPLDAFVKISENRFAYIEYTMDNSNLEDKWLFDNSVLTKKGTPPTKPLGDLRKAAAHFDTIKAVNSNAKLKIYLVTNQKVRDDIWKNVEIVATSLDVEAVQIDLFILSNFLDENPMGHFIREEYFGIDAKLMSLDLIKKAESENHKRYRSENFLDEILIARRQTKVIQGQFFLNAVSLDIIVADSGMGKSSICYDLISNIQDGHVGFQVQPEFIESSPGILEAFLKQLQYHNPLMFPSKELLIKALGETQVLLVVDDINRSGNVSGILNKLLSFVTNADKDFKFRVQIVCPLWTRHFQNLQNKRNDEIVYGTHFLGQFTDEEALAYARQKSIKKSLVLTDLELKEIANKLNHDPLLLGLLFQRKSMTNDTIGSGLHHAVNQFVSGQYQDLEDLKSIPVASQKQAAKELANVMLYNRKLVVDRNYIMKNLPDQVSAAIDQISLARQVFSFNDDGVLLFRHDRVKDFLMSQALADIIANSDPSATDILSDPYYTELIGQAIAAKEISAPKLDYFVKVLPLAVYNSLLFLDPGSAYYQRLLQRLEIWNNDPDAVEDLPELVLWEITWLLLNNDVKGLPNLISHLQDQRYLPLAIFRSGDVNGVLGFFSHMLGLEPYIGDSIRDEIFSHVKEKHLQGVIEQFSQLLGKAPVAELTRVSAYLLAGFLKIGQLLPLLYQTWQAHPKDQSKHFSYLLWAVLNTFDDNTLTILTSLIDYWDVLPAGKGIPGYPAPERSAVSANLHAHNWTFSDEQLDGLTSFQSPAQVELVGDLLNKVDHPKALAFVIGQLARKREQNVHNGSFEDDRWKFKKSKRRLSPESQAFLVGHWQDQVVPKDERIIAFKFWNDNNPDSSRIPLLKTIDESNLLYPQAVYDRMHAGDLSISGEILKQIPQKPFLIWYLDDIWSEENKQFLIDYLSKVDEEKFKSKEIGYAVRELIAKIPASDAFELLDAFWDKFIHFPIVFQTVLHIGNDEMIEKAKTFFDSVQVKEPYLEYITTIFKMFDNEELISFKQFEVLRPYLEYMPAYSLNYLAQAMRRAGMSDIADPYIIPLISEERRKEYLPTNKELIDELQLMAKDRPYHARLDHNWLEELEKREVDHDRLMAVLLEFCDVEHTYHGLLVLGRCLEKRGSRSDIPLLEMYEVKPMTMLSSPNDLIRDFTYSIRRAFLN